MAILGPVTDACLWLGKYSFQGITNQLALDIEVAAVDTTVFGNTWKQMKPGLKGFGVQMNGLWDSANDLGQLNGDLLAAENLVLAAVASTVGSAAYCGLADESSYHVGGKIGDAYPFEAGANGTSYLGRGLLMTNGTLSATANSTGQQLGALSANQVMVANIHVPSVTGGTPTLDIIVQSAAASNFSGATTRATFSQMTAAGAAQKVIAGAIADTWWRFGYTIAGSTPVWTIAGAMGIAPIT